MTFKSSFEMSNVVARESGSISCTLSILSEKTVKGHVSNILSKLHLVDRTQAAVYTWHEGIVGRD
jgi:NarL family two-component system response regulator LiaR